MNLGTWLDNFTTPRLIQSNRATFVACFRLPKKMRSISRYQQSRGKRLLVTQRFRNVICHYFQVLWSKKHPAVRKIHRPWGGQNTIFRRICPSCIWTLGVAEKVQHFLQNPHFRPLSSGWVLCSVDLDGGLQDSDTKRMQLWPEIPAITTNKSPHL